MKTEQQNTLLSNKNIMVEMALMIKKRKIIFKTYSQEQDFLLPKILQEFVNSGHIDKINADEEKVFWDKDLPEQERDEKEQLNRAIELLDRKINYKRKEKFLAIGTAIPELTMKP